jgi:hypothetical protein
MKSTLSRSTRSLIILTSTLLGVGIAGCAFDNTDQPVASSAPPSDVQVVNNASAPQQPAPQPGVVYAPVAPPPNRPEVLPPKPRDDARWVGGHYVWQTDGWQWIGGHYELPPYPGATYSPGVYYKNAYGYRWVDGSWK